jgi:DNA-binding MarR family transcriptional regulator
MKLEEEIKSVKPIPLSTRTLLNILFTAGWIDCRQTRLLRPFGITPQQYNILRILKGSAPAGLSIIDIKGRMINRNSNVGRLIDKLTEASLTTRTQNPQDRRMIMVTIARDGEKLLNSIEQAEIPALFLPKNDLSEGETHLLGTLLDRFRG